MTFNFGTFPVGNLTVFVRAEIEDIAEIFEKHPRTWALQVGFGRGRIEYNSMAERIADENCGVEDWVRLALPQNSSLSSMLAIDVDVDGWVCIIVKGFVGSGYEQPRVWTTCVAEYLLRSKGRFSPLPNGVYGIVVRGNPTPRRHPSVLGLEKSEWLETSLWSVAQKGEEGALYVGGDFYTHAWGIQAFGMSRFDALNSPLMREPDKFMTESTYIPEFAGRGWYMLDYGRRFTDYEEPNLVRLGREDPKIEPHREILEERYRKFLTYLPFDFRGHDRISQFFNTQKIAEWLRRGYGLRWDDPEFFRGRTLVYVQRPVAEVDMRYYTTPRIPIERYRELNGIDLEHINDIMSRGVY